MFQRSLLVVWSNPPDMTNKLNIATAFLTPNATAS